jgi:hypothetical protein
MPCTHITSDLSCLLAADVGRRPWAKGWPGGPWSQLPTPGAGHPPVHRGQMDTLMVGRWQICVELGRVAHRRPASGGIPDVGRGAPPIHMPFTMAETPSIHALTHRVARSIEEANGLQKGFQERYRRAGNTPSPRVPGDAPFRPARGVLLQLLFSTRDSVIVQATLGHTLEPADRFTSPPSADRRPMNRRNRRSIWGTKGTNRQCSRRTNSSRTAPRSGAMFRPRHEQRVAVPRM